MVKVSNLCPIPNSTTTTTPTTRKTLKVRQLRGFQGRAWGWESVSESLRQRPAIHIIPPPNISRYQKKDQHSSYVVENNTLTLQPDVRKLKSGGESLYFGWISELGIACPSPPFGCD